MASLMSGLSPQVRGNHVGEAASLVRWGSIPAGAGEPGSARRRWRRSGVYPRRCGGTMLPTTLGWRRNGLSPQVRGNPDPPPPASFSTGSIPAGAGEPAALDLTPWIERVYPRRCGGTFGASPWLDDDQGLSPQVRGNRGVPRPRPLRHGSIPAGAGEPRRASSAAIRFRVYPRRCGGTSASGRHQAPHTGLSPQVRGNRPHAAPQAAPRRSIPAGAGEPPRWSSPCGGSTVYPRRCGGTEPRRQPNGRWVFTSGAWLRAGRRAVGLELVARRFGDYLTPVTFYRIAPPR